MSENIFVLSGKVYTFDVPVVDESKTKKEGSPRVFAEGVLSYGELRKATKTYSFVAGTGQNEQRSQDDRHVKKLRGEYETGNFTPTSVSLGVYKRHCKRLEIDGGTYLLEIDTGEKNGPLPLTDGGHRFAGLENIIAELQARLKLAEGKDKEKIMEKIEQVMALPIPYILHLDGDTKQDFINLQSGRPVDKAHLFSLRVRAKMSTVGEQEECSMVLDVAKILNGQKGGPFQGFLRMDDSTKKAKGSTKLDINTICPTSASDLSFSLMGLIKVGIQFGLGEEALARCVLGVREALEGVDEDDKSLAGKVAAMTGDGMVLQPYHAGGAKGAATIYIGMATLLAYRCAKLGKMEPDEGDYKAIVSAALREMDEEVGGDYSGTRKRVLMGAFATEFFSDVECEKFQEIPYELLDLLSPSAFAIKAAELREYQKMRPKDTPTDEENGEAA